MLRIRLRRTGSKGQPTYRVVVTDQRNPRNGAFLEIIGFYNPRTRPATERLDEARALHWLQVGAQPSEAVALLLKHTGTAERFERLKKGESAEALVAEAIAAVAAAAPISPKTSFPAPAAGQGDPRFKKTGK
jgi:small subunit ribosomal protein S16